MIYPENFIFDAVADVLRETYSGIFVSGEYTDSPAKFPAVTIVQADNADYLRTRTARGETAANLMYEITVYTNRVGYKKLDAYEIMETVDQVMTGQIETEGRRLGFYRMMCSPIQNLQDSTIFALTARYKGVDMPETDGETVTHRIYIS